MPATFVLVPGRLGLDDVRRLDAEDIEITLDPAARPAIEAARALVAELV